MVQDVAHLEGVEVYPKSRIVDDRGWVAHMMRNDDRYCPPFGEIYFSCVFHGAIKAWHRHYRMELNYVCIAGNIKLVLYDDRPGSSTYGDVEELFIGDYNYCLVKIPPMVWNGFTALGGKPAIVANLASIPHDPNEIERASPFCDYFPYDWRNKQYG